MSYCYGCVRGKESYRILGARSPGSNLSDARTDPTLIILVGDFSLEQRSASPGDRETEIALALLREAEHDFPRDRIFREDRSAWPILKYLGPPDRN